MCLLLLSCSHGQTDSVDIDSEYATHEKETETDDDTPPIDSKSGKFPSSQNIKSENAEFETTNSPQHHISALQFNRLNQRLSSDTSHYDFVKKLLTISSAAKQVKNSANTQSLALHQQALDFFQKAQQAREQQDEATTAIYLNKAKASMFAAVRQAGSYQAHQDKLKRDFDKVKSTVEIFLKAHRRVSKEKHIASETDITSHQIESNIQKSQWLFDQGSYQQAKQLIDQTFIDAKKALIALRGGEVLVRSLKFATKEEEYRYELERNDSHQLLVKVLLKEKLSTPDIQHWVSANMRKASQLREQAERQANQGKFDQAIKLLENSTQQVIQAIRFSGIYIPG